MQRRTLLAFGILSPLLYAMSDALSGLRYEGYSFRDQTISELNAIGSPTRTMTIAFGLALYVAMMAFGVGVWRSAADDRRLRAAGALLVALGAMSLAAVPFASMEMRGTEQGIRGAAHIASGIVAGPAIFAAMGFAAAASGRRFRVYTAATAVVVVGFLIWSVPDGSRIADGLDTPWAGVKERIWVYSYQLWFLVLALALLRRRLPAEASVGDRPGTPTGPPLTAARA